MKYKSRHNFPQQFSGESAKPVIFLAFANDKENPLRYLDELNPERRELSRIMAEYQEEGLGFGYLAVSSEPSELKRDLNQFRNKIIIFHFSGHANGRQFQLEGETGERVNITGKDLLTFLKEEARLKLVVLNACTTQDHVERLFEIGVPAVIATSTKIEDTAARTFSEFFYKDLILGKNLETAFEAAHAVAKGGEKGKNSRGDIVCGVNIVGGQMTWKLYNLFIQDKKMLEWTLEKERVVDALKIRKELTDIPLPPKTFIGRVDDLKKIDEILNRNQSLLLVNGFEGIGKTTVAKRFVQTHYDRYKHIAWISIAQDLNKIELQSTAMALANNVKLFEKLGLYFLTEQSEEERLDRVLTEQSEEERLDRVLTEQSEEERLDRVLEKLKSLPGPNLLVIDKATPSLIDIHEKLPTPPNWHVLITSRFTMETFEMYRLDQLPFKEAETLFLKLYPAAHKYIEDVRALLKEIGYHTLTVELLARACKRSSLSLKPAKVLEKIKAQQFHKISQKVWSDHGNTKHAVYAYLLTVFDLADLDEAAKRQLCQWSILPSEEISPERILQIFSLEENDINDFEETLRSLTDAGWIAYNAENDTYRCHRMIQEVARHQLKPDEKNCVSVIEGVRNLLYSDDTKDNPIDKFPSVIYGEYILQHIENGSTQISSLQNELALRYMDLGRYKEAKNLLEIALKNNQNTLGEEDPKTNKSRVSLALVYQDLGQYEQAAELLHLALASDVKNFGEDHPKTARRRSNLAGVYQDLGQYEQAAELSRLALASDVKNFGEDHSKTARSRSNLALVYQALGQYEQAAELLRLALASYENNLEIDHPNTATVRSNLAGVYQDLGQYKQAAELLRLALASDVKNFGEDHPKTAIRRSNLGMVYKDLGQYEQAAELLRLALASDEKNFGKDHPSTARTQFYLAYIYHAQKKYKMAKELYEAALKTFMKRLGNKHPTTNNSKVHLNRLIKDMNNAKGGEFRFWKKQFWKRK